MKTDDKEPELQGPIVKDKVLEGNSDDMENMGGF